MLHKYKMNNFNIILDVNSGCIHSVDDIVYDIVDFCENKSKIEATKIISSKFKDDDIKDAIDEIYLLIEEKNYFLHLNTKKSNLLSMQGNQSLKHYVCTLLTIAICDALIVLLKKANTTEKDL